MKVIKQFIQEKQVACSNKEIQSTSTSTHEQSEFAQVNMSNPAIEVSGEVCMHTRRRA